MDGRQPRGTAGGLLPRAWTAGELLPRTCTVAVAAALPLVLEDKRHVDDTWDEDRVNTVI